jgi:hypothetical protein
VVFAKGDGFYGHDGRQVRFGQGDDGVMAKEARGGRECHGNSIANKRRRGEGWPVGRTGSLLLCWRQKCNIVFF